MGEERFGSRLQSGPSPPAPTLGNPDSSRLRCDNRTLHFSGLIFQRQQFSDRARPTVHPRERGFCHPIPSCEPPTYHVSPLSLPASSLRLDRSRIFCPSDPVRRKRLEGCSNLLPESDRTCDCGTERIERSGY